MQIHSKNVLALRLDGTSLHPHSLQREIRGCTSLSWIPLAGAQFLRAMGKLARMNTCGRLLVGCGVVMVSRSSTDVLYARGRQMLVSKLAQISVYPTDRTDQVANYLAELRFVSNFSSHVLPSGQHSMDVVLRRSSFSQVPKRCRLLLLVRYGILLSFAPKASRHNVAL